MQSCPCFSATARVSRHGEDGEDLQLRGLLALRQHCPALRLALLPGGIEDRFRAWHIEPDLEAAHRSIPLLAYGKGCLPKVTGPIHRYLLEGDEIRANVTTQYLQDLQENWMLPVDPIRRHQRSRMYRGRLAELQFAEWLEHRNHTIVELEATREGPDIVAQSPEGLTAAYEVKWIGMEDADFQVMIAAMRDEPAGGPVSPYRALNYLLFRIYEAAVQLRTVDCRRTAVVMIDELAWFRFEVQLRRNWIDWGSPKFVFPDEEWRAFMQRQPDGGPSPADLRAALSLTHQVLVYRHTADFEFHQALSATPSPCA